MLSLLIQLAALSAVLRCAEVRATQAWRRGPRAQQHPTQ